MTSMLPAKSAVLIHLQPIWIVGFAFGGIIISLFTQTTSQRYLGSQLAAPPGKL